MFRSLWLMLRRYKMRGSGMPIFKLCVVLFVACLFTAVAARAQDTDESAPHLPTVNILGNSGTWKLFTGDNLVRHQASFGVWYDRINRQPGFITNSAVGVSGAF